MRIIRVRKLFILLPTIIITYLLWKLYRVNEGTIVIVDNSIIPSKIDWLDQDVVDRELLRDGPGEQGTGVNLNSTDKELSKQLISVNGFNALVSDQISLHRSIRDLRIINCKWFKYDRILPPVSIIIPFHNEHWSTLLRTVHSLISRAPESLIEEIILVDDMSTKTFLKQQLDEYVAKNFKKVRILRTQKREGLIRARIMGAEISTGVVLIFIDSHCEAGYNWLPPLLQPIRHDYQTVTCPFIDVIGWDDFALSAQDEGMRGSFDWNLDYKRLPRLPEDKKNLAEPFESPIMAGGLFAISRQWFMELGEYDRNLQVWGGEQYELSFKIWMCGGKIIDIPCSRIGHIYRNFNPFGVPGLGDYVGRNNKRVAEVWMDEYKIYVYDKQPSRYPSIDIGDISEQINLRKNLHCKSFDWFIKNVAFDLLNHYPVVEKGGLSNGKISSKSDPTICIDTKFGEHGDSIQLDKCITENNLKKNGEQNFDFSAKLSIRPLERNFCFDYSGKGITLMLFQCHNQGGNQRWIYNPSTHQLIHITSKKCIDIKPKRFEIYINECSNDLTQKWTLENINDEVVRNEWKNYNRNK